jgi:hypothetical protein
MRILCARALRRGGLGLGAGVQYFLWSSVFGRYGDEDGRSDAFSAVMETLRRRLVGEARPWDSACDGEEEEEEVEEGGRARREPITCARGQCQQQGAPLPLVSEWSWSCRRRRRGAGHGGSPSHVHAAPCE